MSGKVDEPSAGKGVSWEVSLEPRRSWRRSWLGWKRPEGFRFRTEMVLGGAHW